MLPVRILKLGRCQNTTEHFIKIILDRMICGEDPFDVLGEYGLEPDYLESMILG